MPRAQARSTAAAAEAFQAAAKGLPGVPSHIHLRAGDLKFWRDIVAARARHEWTPVTLAVAAQLARCQHDIEVETLTLQAEGTVISTSRGVITNPRAAVVEMLARRQLAILRSLGLGGRAGMADPRSQAASRSLQRAADDLHEQFDADDLLAGFGSSGNWPRA